MATAKADPAESTVTEEDITEEDVETPKGEDETPEPDTESEEADDTEESEELQKKFTQIKGETTEEYLKNLEDAYGHSTAEATRLVATQREAQAKLDQLMGQVAKDPVLAEKLQVQPDNQPQAPSAITDPMLAYAKQSVQQQWEKEYHDFVSDHQEMQTDQDLNAKVINTLQALSSTMQQTQGRLPGMAEGLRMAWQILGRPLNDSEETTRMAVKNAASQSKSPVGRPTASPTKSKFTQAQIDFAQRAYPDKTKNELIELLSQHT